MQPRHINVHSFPFHSDNVASKVSIPECFVGDGSGIDTPAEAAKFLKGLALDFLRPSC